MAEGAPKDWEKDESKGSQLCPLATWPHISSSCLWLRALRDGSGQYHVEWVLVNMEASVGGAHLRWRRLLRLEAWSCRESSPEAELGDAGVEGIAPLIRKLSDTLRTPVPTQALGGPRPRSR